MGATTVARGATRRSAVPLPRGPRGTAALAKTISLLDLVAMGREPPTFAELAGSSGLPRGTLHRLLTALVDHGMIALSPVDHRYVPGTHLLELAQRTWEGSDLRRAAADAIRDLNRRTRETVHLATLEEDSVVYIDKVECDYQLRLHSAVGKRGPVHCTAVGKVMAAYLADDEQRALVDRLDLRRHTSTTLTSRSALRKALSKIRAQGVAFDREEHVTGIHCVAAPVFDFRARCIGGISITAPTSRVDARALESFARWIRDAAAQTTGRVGGVPQPIGASRADGRS